MNLLIEKRIDSEALESVLEKLKNENERMVRALEGEETRLQNIKLATQTKRTESGSNAQCLANLVSDRQHCCILPSPGLTSLYYRR